MPGPPEKGESKKHWISKCIAIVMNEDKGKTPSQAAGQCYGMYSEYKKKEHKKSTGEGIVEGIAKQLKDDKNAS